MARTVWVLLLGLVLLGGPRAGGAASQLSYRDVLLGPQQEPKMPCPSLDGAHGAQQRHHMQHLAPPGAVAGAISGDSSDFDDSGSGMSSGGAGTRLSRGGDRGGKSCSDGARGVGSSGGGGRPRSNSRGGGGGEGHRARTSGNHGHMRRGSSEGDSSVKVWNEWRQQIEDVIDEGREWRVAGRKGRSLTLSPEAWGELSPYVLRVALLGGKLPKSERRERRQLLRWAGPLVAHLQQSLARANATSSQGDHVRRRGGDRGRGWQAGRSGRGGGGAWSRGASRGEGEGVRGRTAGRNVLERMSPTPSMHGIYLGDDVGINLEGAEEPREQLEASKGWGGGRGGDDDGVGAEGQGGDDSGLDSGALVSDSAGDVEMRAGVEVSQGGSDAKDAAGRRKKQQWLSFSHSWLLNLRRDILKTPRLFGPPPSPPTAISLPIAPLLPPPAASSGYKRTLVVDLDETLIHTGLDAAEQGWETHTRPGVKEFLIRVSQHYEVVVFTAGMESYAGQVIDDLEADSGVKISHRLYREACAIIEGGERPLHVKDLSLLGRDLARTMIVDNSPESYMLQPENAIPIKPFFGDDDDAELSVLASFLESVVVGNVRDVRPMLARSHLRGRFRVRSRDRGSTGGGQTQGMTSGGGSVGHKDGSQVRGRGAACDARLVDVGEKGMQDVSEQCSGPPSNIGCKTEQDLGACSRGDSPQRRKKKTGTYAAAVQFGGV